MSENENQSGEWDLRPTFTREAAARVHKLIVDELVPKGHDIADVYPHPTGGVGLTLIEMLLSALFQEMWELVCALSAPGTPIEARMAFLSQILNDISTRLLLSADRLKYLEERASRSKPPCG